MTDAIGEIEDGRERSVPRDIGKLVCIDEDEESNENGRKTSFKQFSEEHKVLNKIKSFGLVHYASKYFSHLHHV